MTTSGIVSLTVVIFLESAHLQHWEWPGKLDPVVGGAAFLVTLRHGCLELGKPDVTPQVEYHRRGSSFLVTLMGRPGGDGSYNVMRECIISLYLKSICWFKNDKTTNQQQHTIQAGCTLPRTFDLLCLKR